MPAIAPQRSLNPQLEALFDLSDDELMRLTSEGSSDAFDQLVRRHYRFVLRLAKRRVSHGAEDAAHNAFIELYRSRAAYEPRGRFPLYLHRLVTNQCLMMERADRIRARASERLEREPVADGTRPADQLLSAREDERDVAQAVRRLSGKLREAVELRYGEGHSLVAVADRLGVPVGTVKSRLSSASTQLRVLLAAAAILVAVVGVSLMRARPAAAWPSIALLDPDSDGTATVEGEVREYAVRRFLAINPDRDGTLSLDEFIEPLLAAAPSKARTLAVERRVEAFRAMDANSDGVASLTEFMTEVEASFLESDVDNEGTVSEEELSSPSGVPLATLVGP